MNKGDVSASSLANIELKTRPIPHANATNRMPSSSSTSMLLRFTEISDQSPSSCRKEANGDWAASSS